MITKTLFAAFFFFISLNSYSQTYDAPAIGLRSHPTMEVLKVEIVHGGTIVYLSIENRITGGTFCADKNIFIVQPDGTRLKLERSEGIPECPQSHKFRTIGEKLFFKLRFPVLKPGTEWIDLIEDCNENCFTVYGLMLDNELSARLNSAFEIASKGQSAGNILLFKNILDDIDDKNYGIEGLLYINIINAAMEINDSATAISWYGKLKSSGAPGLVHYIKYLNDKGIKY